MAPSHTTGHLVTFRNDRLGGRLISLVNMVRLAHVYDLPFKVRWQHATDIASVFNDPNEFFQQAFVDDHFLTQQDWNGIRHDVIRPASIKGGGITALRSLLDQGRNILIDNSFGLVVLNGEDEATVAAQTAEVWADFPLSDTLRSTMNDIAGKLGPQASGYHIRRGDIISVRRVMNRPWPNKYVYDEVYYAHMERTLAQGATPILFSDDADTIARFTQRYPSLKPAETLFEGQTLTEGQRDAAELLAMSQCQQIIAPSHSGFSSTAATLGGVNHIDVVDDLSDTERRDAGQRLMARVKVISDTPLTGTDKGHMAQSLEHMLAVAQAEDDLPAAARIIDRHIQAGLDISFLYPKLVELYLNLGLPEKARAVGRAALKREVHFLSDFAATGLLTGVADMALGAEDRMAEQALSAFWNAPTVPLIASTIGALLQQGKLNATNFLPVSDASIGLWKKHPLRLAQSPSLSRLIGFETTERRLVPVIDPVTWDWMPLMRRIPPNGLAGHNLIPHFEKGFRRLQKDQPGADTDSLQALYDMLSGQDDTWRDRLPQIAAAHPEAAIVQHRASLGAWRAKDYAAATQFANAAVAAAPDAPAYQMWHGVVRGRSGDITGALTDFRAVARAGFNLPRLHLRLAAAAARCGDIKGQARALDAAVRIAPRDAVCRLNRADFLEQSGQTDKAVEDLAVVMRFDQIPPRAQLLWDKCKRAVSAA